MPPAAEALPELQAGARAALASFLAVARPLDAAAVRQPSLLPGWTRAHVVTHVARNADSHVRLLTAAVDDRQVEQYEGGAEGRAADIEAGATRPAAALLDDVETASRRLMALWAEIPDEVWHRTVLTNRGPRAAWTTVWVRWRELAIHTVDLDAGTGPADWPPAFVDRLLPEVVDGLPARLSPGVTLDLRAPDDGWHARVAHVTADPDTAPRTVEGSKAELLFWLLGRGDRLPDLATWG